MVVVVVVMMGDIADGFLRSQLGVVKHA